MAVIQRGVKKKSHPLAGMAVVLGAICAFLAFLAAFVVLVNFIFS